MTKLILASFLMLTTLCGQAQTQTFKSSKYGYSIDKPNDFEQATATGIHIDYKVVNKTDGSSISVLVSKRLPEEQGIDAWSYSKEYFEKVFSYQEPVSVISQTEKIIINGKKTFLIYYSYPSNRGTNLKVIEAYLFVGDNAYVITTTSDEQYYATHKNVFLATIKSIKFALNDDPFPSKTNASTKKSKSKTSWLYFSCTLPDFDHTTHYYSKIYEVANYTEDKKLKIKNCLIEQLKFFTHAETIFLIENEYDSFSDASALWDLESGKKIFGDASCDFK